MAAMSDVDELIERYHQALGEFMKGTAEPAKRLWSRREDASLANPQGSVARVGRGCRGHGLRRIDPSGWQVLRLRDRSEEGYRRACLCSRGRALRSQGSRRAGDHLIRPAGHYDLWTRRGRVESGSPPRGSDNHPSASRVGDPGVACPWRSSEKVC
jgi:hypothetical protein